MFYNRFASHAPVETRRTYIRPSLSHPMSYGPANYRRELKREFHDLNRELRHELNYEHPTWNWTGMPAYTTPAADILELDEQFIIEVALPGVVLDDVQLKIEENVLSLTAKRTPTLFEERATVLQKELPVVYMIRQFEFETDVLCQQIEARLDRGILYISIPKVEAALRIPVSAGIIENHLPNTAKTRVSSKHEIAVK